MENSPTRVGGMILDLSKDGSLNPALPPYSFGHYISWNYRLRGHNQLKTTHIPTRPKAPFTHTPITQRRKWPTRGQAQTNDINTGLCDTAMKAYMAKQLRPKQIRYNFSLVTSKL